MIDDYYNQLAPYYKYMHQDWNTSVGHQAAILDSVIREFFGPHVQIVLDAACGIGTQSIGLAQLGYRVTASDISANEIALAQAEAARRGLQIPFGLVDMRKLTQSYSQLFDVVIACDNAVPHLLSDAEIFRAFEQFYQCTTPGGGCIISVRDYAGMKLGGKQLYARLAHETDDGRVMLFDLWEFDGEDFYNFTTYIVEDKGEATATAHVIRGGRYYCVTLTTLEKLLRQAGFQQVTTIRDSFFQPLLIGVKGHTPAG